MRRFATVPVLLLCMTAVFAATSQIAPKWTARAGLDFWSVSAEAALLRDATTTRQDLDAKAEGGHRRTQILEHIAARLCHGRITLSEALEITAGVASAAPVWFAVVRSVYEDYGRVAPTDPDRVALALYLLLKIESMRVMAEYHGDTAQAAAISALLVQINRELQLQGLRLARLQNRPDEVDCG